MSNAALVSAAKSSPDGPWLGRLGELFAVPLVDLATQRPDYAGIWVPEPEIGSERIGITSQFLDDAETYHRRYASSDHYTALYAEALDAAGFDRFPPLTVLDLGTGSGANSVVPLLKLLPACGIVATDLSPNILMILHRYLKTRGLEERVTCVLMNAMNDYFKPASFDLVVGSALLHHLIDPRKALAAAFRALRPGGTALFFEPFEGANMVRLAFTLIQARAARERRPLPLAVNKLMTAMIVDYEARTGTDKSAERYRYMDDKWLFTRTYLERTASEVGFDRAQILPHLNHATQYRDHTTVLLKIGADAGPDAMPAWAWETIDLFDASFSPEFKRDLLIEGSIVLSKK